MWSNWRVPACRLATRPRGDRVPEVIAEHASNKGPRLTAVPSVRPTISPKWPLAAVDGTAGTTYRSTALSAALIRPASRPRLAARRAYNQARRPWAANAGAATKPRNDREQYRLRAHGPVTRAWTQTGPRSSRALLHVHVPGTQDAWFRTGRFNAQDSSALVPGSNRG